MTDVFASLRSRWALGLGAFLLGVVVYAAGHPGPWAWHLPTWNPAPAAMPTIPAADVPTSSPMGPPAPPSPVWDRVFLGLGIAVLVALALLLGRFVYRAVRALIATRIQRRPDADRLGTGAVAPGMPLTPEQVRDAVAEALRRVDAAATPTNAVIVAWLALEDAAGEHGLARLPAQTPTEFTTALFEASAVPPADTIGLRTLYLRARFGGFTAGPDDVARVRVWLRHIAKSLDGMPR